MRKTYFLLRYFENDLIAKLTHLKRHAKSEKHKNAPSHFIDVRQQTLSKRNAGSTNIMVHQIFIIFQKKYGSVIFLFSNQKNVDM